MPNTTPIENQTSVLIVDDHPIVREGLAAIIERRPDMTVIAQAGNGREALVMYRALQPDVTLMDLRLPEMDGVTAIAEIRKEFPSARVLVLTTYDGDEDIHRALRAGAMGYLLKDAPREQLIDAIRSVRDDQYSLPQSVSAKMAQRLMVQELTPREREVLRHIARGMSNQEVGAALGVTEGTIKVHVNSLLSKLGVSDRTGAVTTALRRGILRLE